MNVTKPPYKGFLIQALVYLIPPSVRSGRQRQLDKRYNASVQITQIDTQEKRVTRLPSLTGFECVGDARRAAEDYGRRVIDNPDLIISPEPA